MVSSISYLWWDWFCFRDSNSRIPGSVLWAQAVVKKRRQGGQVQGKEGMVMVSEKDYKRFTTSSKYDMSGPTSAAGYLWLGPPRIGWDETYLVCVHHLIPNHRATVWSNRRMSLKALLSSAWLTHPQSEAAAKVRKLERIDCCHYGSKSFPS